MDGASEIGDSSTSGTAGVIGPLGEKGHPRAIGGRTAYGTLEGLSEASLQALIANGPHS